MAAVAKFNTERHWPGSCGRALADQLVGNEDEHENYRNIIVRFIKKNCEMFEPVVEDEIPFDDYCRSMGENGTWAGHMELQDASLVTYRNICFIDSYHDGEHYNCVRSKDYSFSGPARPIVIKRVEGTPFTRNPFDRQRLEAGAKMQEKLNSNQTFDYGKCRKDRKQDRKVGSTVASSIQSDGGPPDMGARSIQSYLAGYY
ncbi:hypothetical protein Pfo_019405 [Paulownia fortunei]|nr:hypothetical protein Pfo_019405 [Paulownia fortunei]